jgi:hypothetical protein
MTNASFDQGRDAFEREDWVAAIRSFIAAIQADTHHVDSYIQLIRTYEAAAEEYGDPELLEQATKVCRDARKLRLDEKQRALVDAAADRINDQLEELKEEGAE